jgi:hypothetical protein
MVTHRLFDQLNVLGMKYFFFLLYMWADYTHRPSFLIPVLAHITSSVCTSHRVLSAHILPHSFGSLLFGPVVHIGLQPDV